VKHRWYKSGQHDFTIRDPRSAVRDPLPHTGVRMLEFKTSKGTFTVQLFDKQAPITVQNFLQYVDDGYFAGTIFHRIIPGFMVQGGGMDENMKTKSGQHAPIKNEAENGLKNKRGTLAMARTNDINSATSQFFVNLVDNEFLNNKPGNFGYCVFGRVDSGMDVIDAMAGVKTGTRGGHQDVPTEAITIESVRRLDTPSA
jgi:cyclophilin family peptidyl-prolyl cis-trans isomerase